MDSSREGHKWRFVVSRDVGIIWLVVGCVFTISIFFNGFHNHHDSLIVIYVICVFFCHFFFLSSASV